MSATITIVDETPSGERLNSFTLDDLTEEVTVREIIRARIYQEVQDYNRNLPEVFNGLVQPSDSEKLLNGFRRKKPKPINWETQFEKACEAFQTNGFFILIGDHQPEDLDEVVKVKVDTEVSFIRLVQLVGG